jgi:eukaryotic-like serine/threonine-protein kinase
MVMRRAMDTAADSPEGRAQSSDGELPRAFGRYLLVDRLSKGGMGEIFLARHGLSGFEKLVVIKKVLPHLAADAEFIRRFIDEAQVAVVLQHASIAQVFEVGRVGEEYFLAMEYIEGRDLRRTLDALHTMGQRMPTDAALYVAREVATGLSYAHRRTNTSGESLELVHCDISPPNIVMSFEGETKIIDFGIASSALRGGYGSQAQGFGKYGYLAPEQIIKGRALDHRTDLYALGVVLFEMLTGKRLYAPSGRRPDYRELARKASRGEHARPSDVDPKLAAYDDLVLRALRPEPAERYQSAAEFRDALQHALVRMSPTYSQDDLGTYLRRVFADEAARQRRMRDELEQTDLRLWARQLTRTSPSTVSFALASLPEWVAEAESGALDEGLTAPVPPPDSPKESFAGRGRVAVMGGVVGAALAVLVVIILGALAGGGDDRSPPPSEPAEPPAVAPPPALEPGPADAGPRRADSGPPH